jgi:hypothetical protein
MSGKRIILIFIIPIFFIVVIIFSLKLYRKENSPVNAVEMARKAISEARISKADTYAHDLFSESESLFDSAMTRWQEENDRFFLTRDYSSVTMLAESSATYALKAKISALDESRDFQLRLKERLDSLKKELATNQYLFSLLPLPEEVLANNAKGKMNLSEAELAFSEGRFIISEEKLVAAEKSIRESFYSADVLLKEYFEGYQKWQHWVKNSINYSERNDSYIIIIDKIGREIKIYHDGILKNKFRIELGKNWIGDKQFQGDKATPEGHYKVIDRKQHPHTKFYKALLLDYPNSDDIGRFNHGRKTGAIPGSAKIGGLIEIHGEGGRGNDWTDGCIALKNCDMDIIYSIIRTGTRVTIVGSIRPYSEIKRTSS